MSSPQNRPRGRPKAFHDKTAQNTVQSLDRAMGLLHVLSESGGMTLSELANRSGQSPATVYRVLQTLAAHRMVETESEQIWQIGAGAFQIGSAFLRRTKVVERARLPMEDLMRATAETANLGIEQRDEVVFLHQIETHQTIRAFFPPGTRGPMHASGIGKALLAFYSPSRLERIITAQGLSGFTPQTLTCPEALRADLARIRARGFAIDDQERTIGMRCVAAPVFNSHGEPIAGISVSGPAFRIGVDQALALGPTVRETADRVTKVTGGMVPNLQTSPAETPR